MFGSTNPFGQSSSSSFGQSSTSPFGSPFSQSTNQSNNPFGQSANQSNPFAPKPFGSPASPFGAQTGGSVFGGTSTGVFGQPSTPLFGASSSPAFGSSTPSFGASSTPAFGSSPSFGSSLFGQKPAFGGFGSSPNQSASPFGSTFQQTQPSFGTSVFGSNTTPAFGATTTPAFGSSTPSLFGSTPAFGASSTPAFGASSTPLFGSSSSAQAFGASSTPAFGASSTPAFGASSTPAFGASSTPSFSFGGSTPAFGQSGSTFGSTTFGATPSPFGAQSSPFGAQTSTPTFGSPGFGQSAFGTQTGGTRVTPYAPTPEEGGSTTQPAAKLESISAMLTYKDKSHEELRWEDYQRGDKGGPSLTGQPAAQSSPFSATGAFGQTASNPFSAATSANPFAPKTPAFGSTTPTFGSTAPAFGSTTPAFGSTAPAFSSSSSSLFTPASTSSIFGAAPSTGGTGFGSTASGALFGSTATSAFGSSPSVFGSAAPAASSSAFGTSNPFGSTFNTQSSGLFQSSAPAFGQAASQPAFGQTSSVFGQTGSASAFGSSQFTPTAGFGGSLFGNSASSLFGSTAPSGFGQSTPALSTPFQAAAPAQTSNTFSFGNFGQTPAAPSGGFVSSAFGQSPFGQTGTANQGSVLVQQPPVVTNPFGTLPAMPQMSIGRVGSTPSVQYGISSLPVVEKAGPVRMAAMLVPRHLSHRRIKLPPRRYHPKPDAPKVAYFADEEEAPATPKADAFFMPRENPRSLIIRPIEQWPPRASPDLHTDARNGGTDHRDQNGSIPEEPSAPVINEPFLDNHNERDKTPPPPSPPRTNQRAPNGTASATNGTTNTDTNTPVSIIPRLTLPDYYTVPRIAELAARERSDPGFCSRVRDFTIGRHNFGEIKFLGETDVRALDLEKIVQFGKREVVVYPDDASKPPVGRGLNKLAEVTIMNVRLKLVGGSNKKGGERDSEKERERCNELLRQKSEEQGAEFISYDAAKAEWKFRVEHF